MLPKTYVMRWVGLMLAVTLAGCTTPPVAVDAINASTVPDTWSLMLKSDPSLRVDSADFWTRWNDPTLSQLVKRAEAASPKVEIALANLQAARASITAAHANLWPSATIGANADKSRAHSQTTDTYSANLQGSWSVNLAGADYAQYDAALYEARSQAWALEGVKNQIVAEVAIAYVNWRAAQGKETLLEQTLRSYEDTAKLARWKAESGLGAQSDYETAQVQVKTTQVQLLNVQQAKAQYLNAIARLTAQPNNALGLPSGTEVPLPQGNLAVAIPAQVLMRRPDILSSLESLMSATKSLDVAKRNFFPTLTLTGSLGTQAASIGALGASGTGVGALAGALTMTVLNWGNLVAQEKSAQAQLDLAKANYRDTLVNALEETDNALWALDVSQRASRSLDEAVKHAQNAANLAQLSYQSGLGDYNTLLTAQRNLLSAQESAIENRASIGTAYATLYRTLGGAWTTQP